MNSEDRELIPYIPQGEVIRIQHIEYYNAAILSYNQWLELSQEIHLKYPTPSLLLSDTARLQMRRTTARHAFILFGAITLDAFINFYGEFHKIEGRRDFEEKLPTKVKYQLYPQLVAHVPIDTLAIRYVKDIVALRNELAHPKPKREDPKISFIDKAFTDRNGAMLINKINFIIKAMDRAKPPFVSSSWIGTDVPNSQDWEDIRKMLL